jgi:hemoglobin-like flavoprotein
MPVDALAQKVTRQLLNAWGCAYGRTSAFIIPEAL